MDFLYSLPLLQIHVTAVFVTLVLVVTADAHGLLWLLGRKETLPRKRMELLHTLIWAGLITTVLAGFTMFLSYSEYLLSLPAFKLKIVFVLFLILNAIFIGKHLNIATVKPFALLSREKKIIFLISGAVSTLGWIGAFTCAQFL